MYQKYAGQFSEILEVLSDDAELRAAVIRLAETESMPGKATEGADRIDRFRDLLKELVSGTISLDAAFAETESRLPQAQSPHQSNSSVFPLGWAERLVRTQLSRCYNQAVMEDLLSEGETKCFVPHSSGEDADSNCSLQLAGKTHDIQPLYDRLIRSYREGEWSQDVKIPDHPHCTHTSFLRGDGHPKAAQQADADGRPFAAPLIAKALGGKAQNHHFHRRQRDHEWPTLCLETRSA